MPKWIVTTYLPNQEAPGSIEEFDDDNEKNTFVEALRTRMRTGEVAYIEVEEPATGGKARIV